MELVAPRIEPNPVEQTAELDRASLDVADEDPAAARSAPRHGSTL
jgi:hypothetical protein